MAEQPNQPGWMAAIRREMNSPTPLRILNDIIHRPGLYRLTDGPRVDWNDDVQFAITRNERRLRYDRDRENENMREARSDSD